MTTKFSTYTDQLNNLSEFKKLIIHNKDEAITMLKDISYYSLIDGYKNLFYNTTTREYKNNASINDIYSLYRFDHSLRALFFNYICIVEQKIRSNISYFFSEKYGVEQVHYLNPSHYVNNKRNEADITKLINTLKYRAEVDVQHEYVVYQRNQHNNVPLWVVIKTLSMGQTSKMYSLLDSSLKSKISHQFPNITEKQLIQHLKVLTDFRNVCAHNERLFCHINRYEIPNTPLHKKLQIPMKGEQYIYGRRDLFAVVISLRYMLSKKDFIEFKASLSRYINKATKDIESINEEKLLHSMGFPDNWKRISRYKI